MRAVSTPFLALWLLVMPWTAQATCPAPTTPEELRGLLEEAETAYAALDTRAFETAVDEIQIALPCLAVRIETDDAARLHRFRGVSAFGHGDDGRARASLGAARALDPAFRFPDALVPEGHALTRMLGEASPEPPPVEAVPPPAEGAIAFDGREAGRPLGVATLFQHLDDGDSALATTYLQPGDPLPPYEPRPPEARGAPAPLLVASASAAALSLGLYTAAVLSEQRFKDPSRVPDATASDLIRMRRTTNTLFFASLGVGGAAITGVVVGLTTGGP